MARIMCIDYGRKRCGVAVTDPLQIIATSLDTLPTTEIFDFVMKYASEEEVEKIILGYPTHSDGTETSLMNDIQAFCNRISKKVEIPIDFQDESFTSAEAKEAIFLSGTKKKQRRNKALLDKVSAVIILQRYLGHI